MRLLVLGGTRFIGDRIVRAAQRRGDEVTIVHRGSTEPADEPAGDALAGDGAHIHIDRGGLRRYLRARSAHCARMRSSIPVR